MDILKYYYKIMYPNIYYINLDKRTDRNDHFLEEIKKVDYDMNRVIRVSAIEHSIGTLGCLSSHIKCLKMALEDKYDYAIICEDDFTFKTDNFKSVLDYINTSNIDWNIVLMAINGKVSDTTDPYIKKVNHSQTTSGYIIKKKYIKNLLLLFEELFDKTKHLTTKPDHGLHIDIYWKKIQHENWYTTVPVLGYQYASYSDIEGNFVNYRV